MVEPIQKANKHKRSLCLFDTVSVLPFRLCSWHHHAEPIYLREEAAGELLLPEWRGAQEVCRGAPGGYHRGQ